ncbi:MAG: hypothetical protein QF578_04475 [Alphaproteobacteria bacterium]|nr:hypothetical protein [Alphaproteobacteria bacterium]MDP6564058.1 hypothetical protein [Alphaproteobacteria bacterium]MDP6816063.1 hypothetical protein [Alphaproteobacteria bacterium]
MRPLSLTGLLLVCFGLLSARPGLAAPQMLALVSNGTPVQLQCYRGDCFAEFTAFCLQPERASPVQGTAYRLHDPARLVAVATDRQGREFALDVDKHLDIKAQRSHVAVRIGMPVQRLARLGIRSVRIAVAGNASLLPVKISGDASPLGAEEIATTAGPMRALGDRVVDQSAEWMPAARVANRLINALPPGGPVAAERRRALWASVIGGDAFKGAPAGTQDKVRRVYDDCQDAVAKGRLPSLRGCLESKHDSFVGTLNNRYWHTIKTGS